MIQNNNSIKIAAIAAVTILGVTALIINSEGQFDSSWGEDGASLCIKGKQIPTKIDDCLSKKESSHYLNCNNQ